MNFISQSQKYSTIFLITILLTTISVVSVNAQNRARVVNQTENQQTRPTERTIDPNNRRQRTLTNKIVVVKKPENKSLIKKTSSSKAINNKVARRSYLSATTQSMMLRSIQSKLGIRYRMGTQGPRSYDCSGFVWKVFQESGMRFTRTSARQFWRTFEPVYGDDRFQFGTLVFFNRLGHVGIVVDRNGFYHASSSRGVTYSKFKGYWSKRIVGYRRVPLSYSWEDAIDNQEDFDN